GLHRQPRRARPLRPSIDLRKHWKTREIDALGPKQKKKGDMAMNSLELRILPIGQLQPAPYNPRKVLSPKSPAYKKLKASLAEFGLVEPLVWNETTGRVVGGHARLRILRELGAAEVPVSVVR